MPVAPTIDANVLYEKEIARLNGEVSTLSIEVDKQKTQKAALTVELSNLEKELQSKKDAIAKLQDDYKVIETRLKESHANSQKAIEKREQDSHAVIAEADKKTASLTLLNQKVSSARNFLVGLAEDIHNTVKAAKADMDELALKVEKEANEFYVLRDPKANVPEKK